MPGIRTTGNARKERGMTTPDDRVLRVFEDLVVPEGFKAELIRGEIVVAAGPDRVHNWIVESVMDQIPRARWHRVQTRDLAIPEESSEPRPDLVVYERGAVEGSGRLVPATAVTMVVEVISRTSVDRDYKTKRQLYAALFTEPSPGSRDYRIERTSAFGELVPGAELDLALVTDEFQTLGPTDPPGHASS